MIRIDIFSDEELKVQIKDLVSKYRLYHRDADELEGPERELCEKDARVAEDTLMAMFRSKLQDLEWIKNETNVERVHNRLIEWATRYLATQNLESQVLDSAERCSTHLQRLTSDMSSIDTPALWTFIRGVKYVILIICSCCTADILFFSSSVYWQHMAQG